MTDAAGTTLAVGAPAVADNVLTQPLAGEASGVVTVLWKVVSSDGHPISGEFAFTVTGSARRPRRPNRRPPTPTPSRHRRRPSETATLTPTPTSEPAASDGSSALPWIIGGRAGRSPLVGAVVYLLVSRSRREKALADEPRERRRRPSQPGSEPPADR